MKAHVKTAQEKASLLEKSEIMRINKIWLVALNQEFNFGNERMLRTYAKVCELSGDLYDTPEYWERIDNLLINKYQLGDIIPREDLDERELAMRQVHKANKEKWRSYR